MNGERTAATSTCRNGAAAEDHQTNNASVSMEQENASGEVRQAADMVVDVTGHCQLVRPDRPLGQRLTNGVRCTASMFSEPYTNAGRCLKSATQVENLESSRWGGAVAHERTATGRVCG